MNTQFDKLYIHVVYSGCISEYQVFGTIQLITHEMQYYIKLLKEGNVWMSDIVTETITEYSLKA